MPRVDVLSFTCRDEQDTEFFAQDETYVAIVKFNGDRFNSPIYNELDTNDKINVNMDPVSFARAATIYLYEYDADQGHELTIHQF